MKTRMYNIQFFLLAVFMVFFTIHADLHGQTSSASCNLTTIGNSTFPVTAKLYGIDGMPIASIKSGLDFNLSIQLPGGIPGCDPNTTLYSISIATSSNLRLGIIPAIYPYQFSGQAGNLPPYTNLTQIPSNVGQSINVPFHFLPGTTCNGEVGSFEVTVTLPCGNNVYKCVLKVDLKAEAKNYWEVHKEWVWGNLRGGIILWKITLLNTNPTRGVGDLDIVDGTLTDHISGGGIIISVTGQPANATNSVHWHITNRIYSTTPYVDYYVQSYSCDPSGTLVENCVDYQFCLGKRYIPWAKKDDDEHMEFKSNTSGKKEDPAKTVQNIIGEGGPADITVCCETTDSTSCDTVRLVAFPEYNTNFSKSLTYANTLNYAQGCEGEYSIVVSNGGNVPLNNLVLSDHDPNTLFIPAGINVTRISITGYGVNMDYITNLGSTTSPAPGTTTGPPTYNFSVPRVWDFPTLFPTNFALSTTSGSLMGGYIEIRIRFAIIAPSGTIVKNCAYLNYQGTYTGWGNWCGVPVPPIPDPQESCVDFPVEQAFSVPGLIKCIPSGQQSYMIGDDIVFRVVISNHGQGTLTGTLNDYFGAPQDLEFVLNSDTYSWGEGSYNPYYYYIPPNCIAGTTLPYSSTSPPATPFQVTLNSTDLKNPTWTITNLPGCCILDRAYYLVIEFKAKVKPQSFGNYVNQAVLVTPPAMHTSPAYYNVMRVDKIDVTKLASTAYAEPGQQFDYTIVVKNVGSIDLGNIAVKDQLPACVTLNTKSAKLIKIVGPVQNITNIQYNAGQFIYSFPGIVMKPGERIELVLRVTRTATGANPCCNDLVTGFGNPFIQGIDQGFTIQDSDGPVCVESGLCCDLEFMNVGLQSIVNFFGNLVLTFTISSGVKPIIEADIDLLDYHVIYNPAPCKPLNIGDLVGHIRPLSTAPIGGILNLTPPGVPPPRNNAISWVAPVGNWVLFTPPQLIKIYFVRPSILNIWCCEGKVYYCFKVRLKDVDCNVCEKIVCGSASLSNPWMPTNNVEWISAAAKDAYILQSLEQRVPDDISGLKVTDDNPRLRFTDDNPAMRVKDDNLPRQIEPNGKLELKEPIQDMKKYTLCDCGSWNGKTNFNVKMKDGTGRNSWCGDTYVINTHTTPAIIKVSGYNAKPDGCEIRYIWEVRDMNDGLIKSGKGDGINFDTDLNGVSLPKKYKVIFYPIDGKNKRCEPCILQITR